MSILPLMEKYKGRMRVLFESWSNQSSPRVEGAPPELQERFDRLYQEGLRRAYTNGVLDGARLAVEVGSDQESVS